MKLKIIKPIDIERGIIAKGMDYFLIEEIRDILANFREKSQNITLEEMRERDGMFVEYSYWIGKAIILQKKHLEIAEIEFEEASFNIARKLMKGYKDYPKMATTDANKNAPIFLKKDRLKIIEIKTILRELENIKESLFEAINENARAIRVSERVR